jgi:pimeloyl-ACP methyl ester carboxylesterase
MNLGGLMNGRWHVVSFSLLVVATLLLPAEAQSQSRAPAPEVVLLDTDDGVRLTLTYYPSREGKDATPVLMLHDQKDTRAIFGTMAARLQSPREGEKHPSFAVVTVDLRGHGGSTRRQLPGGVREEIDAAKLTKNLVADMIRFDLKAVRKFLVTKNDAGKLNLNKLCLVGAGMGANVAANWAAVDWAWPPLAVGKQGQDVKGLVLISPRWKYQGTLMQNVLRMNAMKRDVAWCIICGEKDPRVLADADRLYKQLERFHPEPRSRTAGRPRGLEELVWDSSLQGGDLLSQIGKPLEDAIIQFLTDNVADQEYPWIERRTRLD